jgi:ribosomal protein S18 acetylase RimI-like enzyme
MLRALGPPASLTLAGVSLRAAVDADRPFLERLYRSVRWEELASSGWSEEAKLAFLASQFDFQQRHYAIALPGAEFYVVEAESRPIGRIYVDRTTSELHLAELSLLPQWRGRGVGGALVAMLQDEVRAGRATCVTLNVERTNPGARRLYERLGFVTTPDALPYPGVSIEMAWPARSGGPAS